MPVTEYKKAEKEFADRIANWMTRVFRGFLLVLNRIRLRLVQRFTVMFIPHSEGHIFNFQVSLFTIVFVLVTFMIPLTGFFVLAGYFPVQRVSLALASRTIEGQVEEAKQTLRRLETEESEIDNVLKADREVVTGIYDSQIRQIRQLIGSNFFWGIVSGVIGSLIVYFLTKIPRIFSRKTKKKSGPVSGIEEAIKILEKARQVPPVQK